MEAYQAIGHNPSAVWRYLSPLRPDRSTYYSVRENRSEAPFKRAAEFIYLNKTFWNGLFRVNSEGKFNVPFGRPRPDAAIADRDNLVACGRSLGGRGISIVAGDFEETLQQATKGDLVYLDPPYVTGHSNNGFVDYNEVLFSWDDQVRLARIASQLRSRGATVLVSNADHPAIRKLYGSFRIHSFDRKATISGKTSTRGRSRELIALSN